MSGALEALYPDLNKHYQHLTQADVSHFLQHGWFVIPNSMNRKYLDRWMEDLWVRMDMDPEDKSTWRTEYQHLPRHREVPAAEFCSEAWQKIVEVCGGGIRTEDRIDASRETWYGDAFIVNLGTDEKAKADYQSPHPSQRDGWHIDDDFFRLFLDSSQVSLTLLHCYTDIPEKGGGTWLAEDGMSCKRGDTYTDT
jgi:hypothetical protein